MPLIVILKCYFNNLKKNLSNHKELDQRFSKIFKGRAHHNWKISKKKWTSFYKKKRENIHWKYRAFITNQKPKKIWEMSETTIFLHAAKKFCQVYVKHTLPKRSYPFYARKEMYFVWNEWMYYNFVAKNKILMIIELFTSYFHATITQVFKKKKLDF